MGRRKPKKRKMIKQHFYFLIKFYKSKSTQLKLLSDGGVVSFAELALGQFK